MSNLSDEFVRFGFIARVLLASVRLPIFIAGIIGNFINILVFTLSSSYLVTCRTVRLHQLITQRRAIYISYFVIFITISTSALQMVLPISDRLLDELFDRFYRINVLIKFFCT
jgi:hypothetical protein